MRLDTQNFIEYNSKSSKAPRYTIELSFDKSPYTDLQYFTSHSDYAIPSGATVASSTISNISGTSQKIDPDAGLASIGNISISLNDSASIISNLFNTKLDTGNGLMGRRVRVYIGAADMAWADYSLIATQLVDSVEFSKNKYILKLADIQRSERKDIFDLASTTLSATVDSSQLLIPVYSVTGFSTYEHGTSYSDAPSSTVMYIKVEKEVIRCTGTVVDITLGLSFVVDTNGRGVLNTLAEPHTVDASIADNSRKKKVDEYVYLEMPVSKLIYAILTGNLNEQAGKVLPPKWHLNIDTSLVKLTDFTGLPDGIYDTANDANGIIAKFEGLKRQDGKKFIEKELNRMIGAYNPVYNDGSLGIKRINSILAGAGYVVELNETNVLQVPTLKHNMRLTRNSYSIEWNYNVSTSKFTRTTLLIDAASIVKHSESKLKIIKLKGLDGQRHTESTLLSMFNSLRDRYSSPPITLTVLCKPSLNYLEVGDIVNVNLTSVRDYNGTLAPLNRSFEIQGMSINWSNGQVSLNLFASSAAAGAITIGTSSAVLDDPFYTSLGTELKSYLDTNYPGNTSIIGGILHITGNVTLIGSDPATIYYYNAPLTIDNGVIVSLTNTIDLRVKGHITANGGIEGIGQGKAGVANVPTEWPPITKGLSGYLGNTQAGGGIVQESFGLVSVESKVTTGASNNVELFELVNNNTNDTLTGVPTTLVGCSGGGGGNLYNRSNNLIRDFGGDGGNGGGGLITISRGMSFGVSGYINLSGSPGTNHGAIDHSIAGVSDWRNYAISGGAGGSPGGWLCLLDGSTSTIPDTTKLIANQGDTPVKGNPLNQTQTAIGIPPTPWASMFTGYGTPSPDRRQSAHRVQFVPEDLLAVPDALDNIAIPPTVLILTSGDSELLNTTDGTIISRIKASWTASIDQNIGGYELEYKLSSDIDWIPVSNTINLEIISGFIAPVKDGTNYDIRVRSINNIGVRSTWLTISNYTVVGKTTPPPDCDSFLVQRLADGTRLFDGGLLINNVPFDFAGYELRAALGTSLTWSQLTPLHTGLITQLPFETNQLAAGNYTAGIKAVDTTGNVSANAVLVNSTLGDPRIKFSIATVDHHAIGFPGTKSNCWVDLDVNDLIATNITTWGGLQASVTNWAGWTSWADNANGTIIYTSLVTDLGAILLHTPLVSVTSNATSIVLEESHSDDNINFTSYAVSGNQVSGRYSQTRLTLTNSSTAVIVTQAITIYDAETIEEYIENLDTSTLTGNFRIGVGDIRLPAVRLYATIKNVSITLQNVGAGWTYDLIDKQITYGARIRIYNGSGVLADATIDAFIQGA